VSVPAWARSSRSSGSSQPASPGQPAPIISMADFNARDMPCFHQDSTVILQNNVSVSLNQLKVKDVLANGAVIACIVKTLCSNKSIDLIHFKTNNKEQSTLMLTAWHPIKVNGSWVFPAECVEQGNLQKTDCDYVYSLLLEELTTSTQVEQGATAHPPLIINGIECASLNHGIKNDKVVTHSFFGTNAVKKSLMQCKGWNSGTITFLPGCLMRDEVTGLVSSYKLSYEI
jgi:hypothetical protein